MTAKSRGFNAIWTSPYAFQDCIHFLAAIRKFQQLPVINLIDCIPKYLYLFLQVFKNIILKPAPVDKNTVLAKA